MGEPREIHGLGRVFRPDERDKLFPLRSMLPAARAAAPPLWKYRFANGWWGDQGSTPQCVAYAWLHWLEDGPVSYVLRGAAARKPLVPPTDLYRSAQRVDPWPGENYDGTSVRAGAKILQELGAISAYYWAWDVGTVLDSVATLGPVVMGTNWYTGMFFPDSEGHVRITGVVEGGHAWIVNGYNRNRGIVRCKNSWGQEWGRNGHFYLSVDNLARLLQEQGEACMATELRVAGR